MEPWTRLNTCMCEIVKKVLPAAKYYQFCVIAKHMPFDTIVIIVNNEYSLCRLFMPHKTLYGYKLIYCTLIFMAS